MFKGFFEDIVSSTDGFLRGPFGGDLKKEIFVPKSDSTYKVYEQSVVLEEDETLGRYYISKKYFDDNMSKFEVKPNDFIVSCSGVNYGAIFQLPNNIERGIINQALLRIRLNEKIIEPHYFYYYFKSYIVKAITGGTGDSTIPNFPPMSVVKKIPIELPDILEQRKIGKILRKIDNKIQNNLLINKQLESMAKTIYDYWFLQFEFPNEEGKPYKSFGGKMEWNDELKREIPIKWKCSRLNYFIEKDRGGDWGKSEKQGNYIKKVTCIRGADFPSICSNKVLKTPTRYILKKNENKILKAGDIIVEISGGSPVQSTGRVCYINSKILDRFDTDIITSNFCKAFSLRDYEFTYWFYMLWKTLYDNGVYFNYESKTTGIKNLLFDILCEDYPIIYPEDKIIKKYNKIISKIFNKIQENNKENQELESLRDFLLPLLMNGQVGFRELALVED